MLLAAVIAVAAAAWWWLRVTPSAPPLTVARTPVPSLVVVPIVAPSPAPAPAAAAPPDARRAGSPLAAVLNASGGSAARDVEVLHTLLRHYLRHLGRRQGLPIGNDSDLVKVFTGRNPMRLVVVPANHPAINREGRLCDRWGTPYFIHPRGGGAYEVRSAGPDRRMFTNDDSVSDGAVAE